MKIASAIPEDNEYDILLLTQTMDPAGDTHTLPTQRLQLDEFCLYPIA